MNIALCHENVDPTRGGCETYIADLARRLVADGHRVHLYASRWNTLALPRGLACHYVPRPAGPRFLRPWLFAKSCLQAVRSTTHDVTMGFDKTYGLDVHYPQGGIYAASQVANVSKHRGPARIVAAALKHLDPAVRSFLRLERRQMSQTSRPTLIVNSEMSRRHASAHYGLDASSVHVVHAAIDPKRFGSADRAEIRADMRQSWKVPGDMPVALFVAMNYRLKGLDSLFDAVRLIPPEYRFRLVIVGHPNFKRYAERARRLGIAERVVFHGFCADSRRVYFGADFLVHPTFYDPCSLVALEALACALPVITTQHNGASELLNAPHDGTVLDDPHDHAALAAAIERMLDDEQRRECARQARRSATLWTFDNHYRKMTAILEGVAAHKRLTRPLASAA